MASTEIAQPPASPQSPPRLDLPESIPPRDADIGSALRRRWWIVLLLGALLALAGAVAGRAQKPVYSAKSTLTVANVSYDTRSVPGFAQAAQALASSYSQSVTSDAVVEPVARELRLAPRVVRDHLSATPVPNSTLFTLTAQGADARSAVLLGRSATRRLLKQVQSLDTSSSERALALGEFQRAVRAEARASDRLSTLRAQRRVDRSAVSLDRIVEAVEEVSAARLRADAARGRYVALRQSTPSAEARRVAVLSPAASASSDRDATTQRLAAIGLVAGLALGLVVALALSRRGVGRSAP